MGRWERYRRSPTSARYASRRQGAKGRCPAPGCTCSARARNGRRGPATAAAQRTRRRPDSARQRRRTSSSGSSARAHRRSAHKSCRGRGTTAGGG
eukprot:4066281-Pleurochrysis_carterae.AAC.1